MMHRPPSTWILSCLLCSSCAPARHGPSPVVEATAPLPSASTVSAPRAFDASRIPEGQGFWCFTRPRVQTGGTTSHPYERCLRTEVECAAWRTDVGTGGDEAHEAALRAATSTCTLQTRSWCTTRAPGDVKKCTGADCGKSPLWFCTVTKQACTTLVERLRSLLSFSDCEETS